jgi:hypothetical protein
VREGGREGKRTDGDGGDVEGSVLLADLLKARAVARVSGEEEAREGGR